MDSFFAFFTHRENISLLLSVVAICLTIFQLIKNCRAEKTNYEIKLFNSIPNNKYLELTLDISIVNHSKLPLTITGLKLEAMNHQNEDLERFCFGNEEEIITSPLNGRDTIVGKTTTLPINVPAKGCCRALIKFKKLYFLPSAIQEMDCTLISYHANKKTQSTDLQISQVMQDREKLGIE